MGLALTSLFRSSGLDVVRRFRDLFLGIFVFSLIMALALNLSVGAFILSAGFLMIILLVLVVFALVYGLILWLSGRDYADMLRVFLLCCSVNFFLFISITATGGTFDNCPPVAVPQDMKMFELLNSVPEEK